MQVLTTSTNNQFTRAKNVKIPEIYSRRFFTGKEDLDNLFGGSGFLPGFTFTLAAAPGTGKTSWLIQLLEYLERNGKKTAYISGEETIEQLAFTAQRLNVTHVPLANLTNIDDVCAAIEKHKFDFIVLDSLPALTGPDNLNSREIEEYIANKIIQTAKTYECAIGTILHFTKTGTYKGSTLLPHSVDCNIIMTRNKEDSRLRDVEITKNRFGSTGFTSFEMTENGFTFDAVESDNNNNKQKTSKKDVVLDLLNAKRTMIELVQETNIGAAYLATILRDLQTEGKIIKIGRGTDATFEKK